MKPLIAILALTLAAGFTGCTDDEVLGTIGAVAVVGGAVAVGVACADSSSCTNVNSGHYECEGGTRQVCHTFRDYRGRANTECRDEYDGCASRGWMPNAEGVDGFSVETLTNTKGATIPGTVTKPSDQAQDAAALVTGTNWAATFDMSYASADLLVAALQSAQAGDGQALLSVGLTTADAAALASLNMPSDAGIDALAQAFNQSPDATRAMFSQILTLAKARQNNCQSTQDSKGHVNLSCA